MHGEQHGHHALTDHSQRIALGLTDFRAPPPHTAEQTLPQLMALLNQSADGY